MVRMSPQPDTGELLAGLVERVTYHNAENGFCVLRARARGHRDVVTVVGHAAAISAGEWIMASGEWVNDRTHGQQFKARFLRTSTPTSADGIEKYLSSGMIRGVGPVYAKKLVRAFGDKVFDIIESAPDRLREVEGIGPVRAASILAAWALRNAPAESSLHRCHQRQATGRVGWTEEGSRHCGAQRFGAAAMVEIGRMAANCFALAITGC
jgi:exodeoxyribonuclease V alpha subunit